MIEITQLARDVKTLPDSVLDSQKKSESAAPNESMDTTTVDTTQSLLKPKPKLAFFISLNEKPVKRRVAASEKNKLDFSETDHPKEHINRINTLVEQSNRFETKTRVFKRRLKEKIKHFKSAYKNLLIGYQVNTLSHLLISLIGNPKNFLGEDVGEMEYSLNQRKIDLSYFDSKPQFKSKISRWENQLFHDI